jgi:cell filamentation protein, protein adenylyltransferase
MGIIGNNVKQPGGYQAFVPAPFPPKALPALDNHSLSLLERATVLLGRLDGLTELLPDVNFFIFMYVRKEAVLSSQLEGTQATMIDAIRAEESMRHGLPEDVDDIIRYISAMNFGLERLKTLPLSMRLIYEVHERLLGGARVNGHVTPGEVRTTQNWIGGGSPATARFVPPPPHLLRACLGELELFLHSEDAAAKILKTGLAHAQFETIHPFADGNGRTGRLLITFYLCQQGILNRPVLYLSEYFKRNRETYFDSLHAYHERDDILGWLKFFFEGVAQVAEEAISVCKQITALRERDMGRISAMGKAAPNGVLALRTLFKTPIVPVRAIEEATGLSRTNANMLVKRFVDTGILIQSDMSVEYGRTFVYDDYLRVFNKQAAIG